MRQHQALYPVTTMCRLLDVSSSGYYAWRDRAPSARDLSDKEMGVRPSMGSVGDAYDNALCESFFATLECELLARNRFTSQTSARMAVFQFIEGWYNPHRRHSALGYLSPLNFERRARAAA